MRSIIVTGGSRGIGSEICTTLSKAGYAVAINYNHSAEKLLYFAKKFKSKVAQLSPFMVIFQIQLM